MYLITDRQLAAPRLLADAVAEAVAGGVRAIQLREKDVPLRELLRFAREIRTVTAAAGARLFINDRIDVMWAVDADGVHLRANSLPTSVVRRVIGPRKVIGVSTHTGREIDVAAAGGADFVTFGPVFETPSKRTYGPPVGLSALEAACRRSSVPVYALGGVTRDRFPEIFAAGASGAALISDIMSERDICRAAGACVDAVTRAAIEPHG